MSNLRSNVKIKNYKKFNNKQGWTVSFGVEASAKHLRGGSGNMNVSLSYDKIKKKYFVSINGGGSYSVRAGGGAQVLGTLGISNQNQLGIQGRSTSANLSYGIANLSASKDGSVQLGLGAGAGASGSVSTGYTHQFVCMPIEYCIFSPANPLNILR